MNARHGFIVGKFYPPHRGHHDLINTASEVCDDVTVVVAASDVESIPVELRTAWIEEEHAHQCNVHVVSCIDNYPIDYGDAAVWDLHMKVFLRSLSTSPVTTPVDAVFSNEPYGKELARRLSATAVDTGLVGAERRSASMIRADPIRYWDELSPSERAWFTKRIVVVGAESTGTTTVALALRDHFRRRGGHFGLTQWVPEFGRDLTWQKLARLHAERAIAGAPRPSMDDITWTDEDFVQVCHIQNEREETAARLSGPVIICDTDSWATGIWQERYMGHRTPEATALSGHPNKALYLLTHHVGVPFVQDGVRDGEVLREAMTDQFAQELTASNLPHVVLDDRSLDARVSRAVAAIDATLASGWPLGVPLEYRASRT